MTAGRKGGRGLGPDRYHEVRYEALIDEPDEVISGVCVRSSDWTTTRQCCASSSSPIGYRRRSGPIPARPAGRAALAGPPLVAHRYAEPQLEAFEAAAGGLLTELGYPGRCLGRHARAQARAAQGVFRWQARRARARLPGQLRRSLGTR